MATARQQQQPPISTDPSTAIRLPHLIPTILWACEPADLTLALSSQITGLSRPLTTKTTRYVYHPKHRPCPPHTIATHPTNESIDAS